MEATATGGGRGVVFSFLLAWDVSPPPQYFVIIISYILINFGRSLNPIDFQAAILDGQAT